MNTSSKEARLLRVIWLNESYFDAHRAFPTMKPLDSDKKASMEAGAPAAAASSAPVTEEKIDF